MIFLKYRVSVRHKNGTDHYYHVGSGNTVVTDAIRFACDNFGCPLRSITAVKQLKFKNK